MKTKERTSQAQCRVCNQVIQIVLSPHETFTKQLQAFFEGFCSTRCQKINKQKKAFTAFKCDHCDKQFNKTVTLQSEGRLPIETVRCPNCGTAFTSVLKKEKVS